MADAAWSHDLQARDEEGSRTRCHATYSTGEFKGMGCIERGKEQRHGLPVCRAHAKVIDRWAKFGSDYVRSMVKYEWGVEINA